MDIAKAKILKELNKKSIDELKKICVDLYIDYRDEATIVYELAMDILDAKMLNKDFIAFCDNEFNY